MMTVTETLDFDAMRAAMVSSQLRTTAVADPRVIAAMATVPRERFVPAGAEAIAYRDTAVPLSAGRSLNVPMATGKLLTEARIMRTDRVLLIGAASGYTAAVLAMLADDVVAVESDAALVAMARAELSDRANVTLVEGAIGEGHAKGAPYDVLVIDGAIDHVPDALVAQLKPRARIVSGIADRGITRLASGVASERGAGMIDFADVDCVMLPGFARAHQFSF